MNTQRTPPTNLAQEHTLVPTVTRLIPYNISDSLSCLDTARQRNSRRWTKINRWRERVEGSTHVQRVLVDDDMGHAMCHQTTWVTWETETDSCWAADGGWEGRLDSLKPKTQVKNWFCVRAILKIPLHSPRYLTPFYSFSLQPSLHLYCGPLNTANPQALPFYECWINYLKVCGKCGAIQKKKSCFFFCWCRHLVPTLNAHVIPVEHLLFDH